MSGGHFNYDQYRITQMVDDIEHVILFNNSEELDEWGSQRGHQYTPETITEFKKAIEILNLGAVYAQRIDWLLSGDDSEESFHKRLKEDLGE